VAKIHVGSFATKVRGELSKLLAEIGPGTVRRSQYYSGGAEAVEAALRLAKSYTRKTEVIGFWGGFHGKTLGVIGLIGMISSTSSARFPPASIIHRMPTAAAAR
jgi:4-aminobutyrate aminotransferase-like enzyme